MPEISTLNTFLEGPPGLDPGIFGRIIGEIQPRIQVIADEPARVDHTTAKAVHDDVVDHLRCANIFIDEVSYLPADSALNTVTDMTGQFDRDKYRFLAHLRQNFTGAAKRLP